MSIPTPVQLRSKLPDVGTTIFSVIGQLSAQHQAVNLSQGAPNFPCDPRLIAGVTQAMEANRNQYAPMTGLGTLKTLIAGKAAALYGAQYDDDSEVLVTASASEGIYCAISGLVHPGDEVIYFEPSFDSYAPIVRLQGATPVAIKLTVPDFAVNWDEVQAAITPRTRMIISSFGKTFHVTGWRVGYCLAPAALMDEVIKVHQFLMFSADTPMQYAFADYMADPARYLSLGEFYQRKRDLMQTLLADSPFKLLPSAGSFFLLASYEHFSDESDSEMVKRLIVDYGVATIPLSAFYTDGTDNKLIRLSFAKDEATLRAGAQALCQVKPR